MSLPRTSATAAKQILDSTRVYREFVRVRKEAERVKGSLFWKKVGPYEYLAQKVEGKVTYLGRRSPETEHQFEEFKQKKVQLVQRARKLKESVQSYQRMNKAVRAGAAPTPLVEVLQQLEERGLSEDSVVLGTPALFAYGQPAGVRIEEISSATHGSMVEDAKHHVQVLVHAPESAVMAALPQIRESVDAVVEMAPAGKSGARTYYLFEFKFGRKPDQSKCRGNDAYWRALATKMAPVVEHAGKYEQVVIGKTGTMATMRTLDPQFFSMVNHAAVGAHSSAVQDPEVAQWQASVVDALISDHLVVTKLPESECRQTVDDIAQRVFSHA